MRALFLIAPLVLVASAACGRAPEPAAPAAKAAPAERAPSPKVLVEATNQAAALTVQVLDAQRVTADTVRIEIALINTSRAPEPLDVVAALTGSPSASFTPEDLCLLTPDGSRRLFVLRDASDKPLTGGGFEPLQPGERRNVWAVFPSPGAETAKVSLVLASMVLADVPIAPAAEEAANPAAAPASTAPAPAPAAASRPDNATS
jgi:hypothetical protein